MDLLLIGIALWYGGGPGGAEAGGGILGMLCSCFCPLVIMAPMIIGMWKAFEKAGKPGWAALVPFYNLWVLVEIGEKPSSWFFLIMCVPCVGVIYLILLYMEIAVKFGQGAGFGIGLAFLGIVFWPILGFGSAQYEGGSSGRRRRRRRDEDDDRPRRRRRDEEEDEEEDERPRRRPRDEDEDEDEDDRPRRRRRDDDDDD